MQTKMKLTSPAFISNGKIPEKYTCDGANVHPPLEIFDPPTGSKSFALIVHDHDAQSGDFVHWLIWNIDPDVRQIMEATTPIGAREGTNDFGKIGWNGPCPPSGSHRYEFHLYSLSTKLDLPATSAKIDLRARLLGNIIEEASLIGVYR